MAYKSKTDKELKDLAFDIVAGNVFHDQMINPNEDVARMLRYVFIPLSFMKKEQAEEIQKDDIKLFYEYMNKAGARSVNGYPQFFSMQMLSRNDVERLNHHIDKVVEFRNQDENDD